VTDAQGSTSGAAVAKIEGFFADSETGHTADPAA
jgi:hypothetical protein